MQSGLWFPLFEELAEPAATARLGAEAEEAGWHGVFVWDQLRWRAPIRAVADPWIALTAIAGTVASGAGTGRQVWSRGTLHERAPGNRGPG